MALFVSLNLGQRMDRQRNRHIMLDMAVAEQGGFSPASVRVQAGELATLDFYAGDVAHAVAIGPGMGVDLGTIPPGEHRSITVRFERPGVYTFYCNLWCSKEHWRMRGTIEVVDEDGGVAPAPVDPVIARLVAARFDIDAPTADVGDIELAGAVGALRPNADLLAALAAPAAIDSTAWRRTHALGDAIAAWSDTYPDADATTLLVVASAWWNQQGADPAERAAAADLYAKNCAACHGVAGSGDGPAAALAATPPVAFTLATLYNRPSDVLYAKIRRGGMGTGMPNFGTLFTPDETWSLVDYLWWLVFPASKHPEG